MARSTFSPCEYLRVATALGDALDKSDLIALGFLPKQFIRRGIVEQRSGVSGIGICDYLILLRLLLPVDS
jgi:hypothetical protein